MLKRISVDQLRLGMHLKEFCGSWMEHPFWRSGFVLKDPKDITSILSSSIKEVWIDCDKGLDIPEGVVAASVAESEAVVDEVLKEAAAGYRNNQPVSLDAEMARAAKICQSAKLAVVSMFQEVRMGNSVDSVSAQRLVEEISDSVARNSGALISLARLKSADDYTYMHSVAVCALMIALARQMGLDDATTNACGVAGLLHDMGKALTPLEVLNKPGKLTDEEFGIMKSHPVAGHRILLASDNISPVSLDVCLHHHEKVDGSGYPKRFKADEISLHAKMGAVCDVYDAITSNRPYRMGWDPAEALRKMAEWSEGHFDKSVFQMFVKSLGIYPIGSLVRLQSSRIGVVIEQNNKSLTKPVVKVFFSTKSDMRIMPEILDLSSPRTSDKIAGREDPEKWKFHDLTEMWSGFSAPVW